MRLSLRSAVSASAAIAAVIGIVVGVQLASAADGQAPVKTIDRGGQPLLTNGPLGGDDMPMDGDGFPVTVVASTVTVNGTPTVKTITVSKPPTSSTKADVVGATVTTTTVTTTTTTPPTTTTTTTVPVTTTTTDPINIPTGR
ncbi:hypothetical protein [Kutzneria sp. CA-103260]|uniref:hypothetical protein n=1 Tax=Kutzneria sp. CA-103260 TaxID=2802641 RepID=UPI001BAE26D6|nr:hypothetical protein [Kutzneria sp. CA-103260]QUQ69583.1 hypothetical protein JJ691_73420 [Kutzneria sp. CA-103260]